MGARSWVLDVETRLATVFVHCQCKLYMSMEVCACPLSLCQLCQCGHAKKCSLMFQHWEWFGNICIITHIQTILCCKYFARWMVLWILIYPVFLYVEAKECKQHWKGAFFTLKRLKPCFKLPMWQAEEYKLKVDIYNQMPIHINSFYLLLPGKKHKPHNMQHEAKHKSGGLIAHFY